MGAGEGVREAYACHGWRGGRVQGDPSTLQIDGGRGALRGWLIQGKAAVSKCCSEVSAPKEAGFGNEGKVSCCLYPSLRFGGKCQASSWESCAGTQLISRSDAGREVGNLKETGKACLLQRCVHNRDLAHPRILKLEGFKKKGQRRIIEPL